VSKDFDKYPNIPSVQIIIHDRLKGGNRTYNINKSVVGNKIFSNLIDITCDCSDMQRTANAKAEKELRKKKYLELRKEFGGIDE